MGYSVLVLRMKIGFPLLVLFLLLSFRVDPAMSSNDYIDSYCNTDINYLDGSEFQTNMRLAFATLIADVNPLGFSNATQGEGSDRVYAMAQCRGDVDQNLCKECIDTSTQKVNDTDCSNPMEAIIWYENCQLRYSNTDFFGILDVADSGYNSWNDVVADESFNEKLGSLLQNLTSLATTPTEPASKLMFATGNILYTDLQTIYGLVQCTGDTSLADCKQCLDTTRSQIPTTQFCDHSTGCEIVTGSCRLRYDTKLFYGTTTTSIPSPPPPPSDSSPSPSLPPNSAPLSSPPEPSVLTPPPNSAPLTSNTTTSDKRNHSSGTSVAIITIITFAFTTTNLLAMPSWL